MQLQKPKPRRRLCSKVKHATEQEAQVVADVMFKRWNEKQRRPRGQGRGLGKRTLWEMSLERAVISNPYQLPAPQAFYPKYCYLCRAWHVASKPVSPKSNHAHSEFVRQIKKVEVNTIE